MAVNIGNAPLKAAYVGATPLKAIYVGANQVWSAFSGPVVHDFVEPGTFQLDIPPGAGFVAVALTGGGRAGEPGDGAFGKAGGGGNGGKGIATSQFTAGYDLPIEITVGAGGKPSDSKNSSTAAGKPSKVVLRSSSLEPWEKTMEGRSDINTSQTGGYTGWSKQGTAYDLVLKLSLTDTHPGGPFRVTDTGVHNGPGGTGSGGAGTRGGGGAGGDGGSLGRYSKGGAGGDGAVRVVFWKDKEEWENFTA